MNQKFVLKSDKDQDEVNQVTELVNQVFSDIQARAQNIPTQNVAILAALNIAERMLDEKKRSFELVHRWKARLENILGLVHHS